MYSFKRFKVSQERENSFSSHSSKLTPKLKFTLTFLLLLVFLISSSNSSLIYSLVESKSKLSSISVTEFPIATGSGEQKTCGISGNYAMWIGNGSSGHGVYLYNLQTSETVAMNNSGTEYVGGIDGNWIVWSQINSETGKSETYVMNCSGGGKNKTYESEDKEAKECADKMKDKGELQRVLLSKKESISAMVNTLIWWNSLLNEWSTISDILSAKINTIFYGDYVFWSDDRNGSYDIYGYNLETKIEFPICNAIEDQSLSTYNSGNNFIAWTDWRNAGPDNSDIYGYNFGTQEEFIVSNTNAEEREAVAYGNKIAWIEKERIVDEGGNIIGWADKIKVKELNTGEISTIQDTSTHKKSLRMNDEFIIWVSSFDVNVSLDSLDIYGYCLTNGVAFTVCTEDKGQLDPELLGNRIIWQDMRNDENDIYGATLEIIQ